MDCNVVALQRSDLAAVLRFRGPVEGALNKEGLNVQLMPPCPGGL